jgi:hypothetical protein
MNCHKYGELGHLFHQYIKH